jgi:hypothetical protein
LNAGADTNNNNENQHPNTEKAKRKAKATATAPKNTRAKTTGNDVRTPSGGQPNFLAEDARTTVEVIDLVTPPPRVEDNLVTRAAEDARSPAVEVNVDAPPPRVEAMDPPEHVSPLRIAIDPLLAGDDIFRSTAPAAVRAAQDAMSTSIAAAPLRDPYSDIVVPLLTPAALLADDDIFGSTAPAAMLVAVAMDPPGPRVEAMDPPEHVSLRIAIDPPGDWGNRPTASVAPAL